MRSDVDVVDLVAKVVCVMDRDGLSRVDRRVEPEWVWVHPGHSRKG